MKAYGGVDVEIHIFLTSALAGGEWSAARPVHLNPDIHWIGGWVDPRAGLDDVVNLPGLELRTLGRPARSPSLYRLIHHSSYLTESRASSFQRQTLFVVRVTLKNAVLWVVAPRSF
jgi:hypothetical protein